jgi:hypothetical protein
MIYCTITTIATIAKATCKLTWAKHLSSFGLYHGEILGGVMMQLILNATESAHHKTIPPVLMDCNNNGVVSHGNAPFHSLPTNQFQADVHHAFKHLVSVQPFHVIFKYVQSQANDTKKWQYCTLKECINIKVDRPAKKALKAAHSTGKFIEGTFPNKQIWITMGRKKVTGSL